MALYYLVLCFRVSMLFVLYLALEHVSLLMMIFSDALCDCMRRFTSSCAVFEVQQCFIIFIGKSSLTMQATFLVHTDNTIRKTVVINTTCIRLSSIIQTVTLYTFSLLAELHGYAYTSHFQHCLCMCIKSCT